MKKIISCAPGRICLFGDHQDYIQLPVIACAIDRLMQIDATENGKNHFEVNMPDLDQKKIIPLNQSIDKIQTHANISGARSAPNCFGFFY